MLLVKKISISFPSFVIGLNFGAFYLLQFYSFYYSIKNTNRFWWPWPSTERHSYCYFPLMSFSFIFCFIIWQCENLKRLLNLHLTQYFESRISWNSVDEISFKFAIRAVNCAFHLNFIDHCSLFISLLFAHENQIFDLNSGDQSIKYYR